jgi:multicomponent K+:H+ antiporter subunit A
VVNVIIVDFRAFDTLGEITVMAVAAFIVHALLSDAKAGGRLRGAGRIDAPPLMLQLASQWILPFAVLVSLHLFIRGHNLPGGGFIAGLVLALGFMLQAVAHGLGWMDQRTRFNYRLWIGWGLLISGGVGIASAFVGSPFLTSTYDYPWLPGVGGVPMASAAVFDLGVYLVVTGATLLLLLTIARFGREEAR